MGSRQNLLVFLSLFTSAIFAATLQAADEPKDLDEVPKAVMDSLKAKFADAKITKWSKETENGKVVYDIEFKLKGRKAEADIAEDGTVLSYEKEFDAKDLPKAVTDSLEKKYPKAKMKEVMEITEVRGKREIHGGFEIVIDTADKKEVELTIAKDGKILEDSTEKKAEKK
ncbi:MAG: PepSY-like domain-containing protein [Gemmataceae bacterium]